MKYYGTLCTKGHFWGSGESKRESRNEANFWIKENGFMGDKLLPSIEISKKIYDKINKVGGNKEDIGETELVGNVLYLENEVTDADEKTSDNFKSLSIHKKLNAIWEKLNKGAED